MKKLLCRLIKILPVVVLLFATFSHAQTYPQPTPTNPYPWTQQPSYSPQYYDWLPLRYFGPKYAGYLNQEEPIVFVSRRLEILNNQKPINVIADKLGIVPAIYNTGVDSSTNKALVAGSLKRNDAGTVDLGLSVSHQNQVIWSSPDVFNYNLSAGTITDKTSDLLPFVYQDIPVNDLQDTFVIKDTSTGQILFGPMSFETLGDIEKLEKPFEESWYYKIKDEPLEKSSIYKTESECLAGLAADLTRPSQDPKCYQDGGFTRQYDIWWFYYTSLNPKTKSAQYYPSEQECKIAGKAELNRDVICYTEHLKTIDVKLVTDNSFVVGNAANNYSKITKDSAHLLFRVDTYGATADLGVYYKKFEDKTAEPQLIKAFSSVHSDLGKSVNIIADQNNLVKDTKYQIYVINQADLVDDKGDAVPVSKIRKLFEGTIVTKETNSFIQNTIPTISGTLLPDFDLGGILNGPGGKNPLRLVTCGYDGADITTTVNNKLVVQPGPIDGKLLKPDPYFDENKDGKITGDGEDISSEWKNKNDMMYFQPHGETCDFDDIIGLIRRVQRYILVIVPLIAAGMFAWAGYLFLTGGGNATTIKKAKDIMKYTMLGIVIVLLAWLVVANIYVLLGIDKSWSWLKL